MSQYRVLHEFRSSVHGGGSSTTPFDTEAEAVAHVDEPMPAGEYIRIAQRRDGDRWETIHRRDRRKGRKR